MREAMAASNRIADADDEKAATQGVRIGDRFSHCASACVPKDGLMVHLLRLIKC